MVKFKAEKEARGKWVPAWGKWLVVKLVSVLVFSDTDLVSKWGKASP